MSVIDMKRMKNLVKFLKDVPKEIKKFKSEHELAEAELLLRIVRNHIKSQDLAWTPLSPKYLEFKKSVGLSTKTWVATSELYKSLDIQKSPAGYFIGAEPLRKHKDSGIEINRLIGVLEYGSPGRNIPARPLFRPSHRDLEKGASKRFVKSGYNHFKERLKKI